MNDEWICIKGCSNFGSDQTTSQIQPGWTNSFVKLYELNWCECGNSSWIPGISDLIWRRRKNPAGRRESNLNIYRFIIPSSLHESKTPFIFLFSCRSGETPAGIEMKWGKWLPWQSPRRLSWEQGHRWCRLPSRPPPVGFLPPCCRWFLTQRSRRWGGAPEEEEDEEKEEQQLTFNQGVFIRRRWTRQNPKFGPDFVQTLLFYLKTRLRI